jgi:hypothetical protein
LCGPRHERRGKSEVIVFSRELSVFI